MLRFLRKTVNLRPGKIKPTVLLVIDGWGIAQPSHGNAISQAKTPNMDYFWQNFPHGKLIASGEAVGLPASEVGNTEVGHLTLGSGRVTYQDLVRINNAIEDGSFFENPALLQVADHVKSRGTKLHIMGLLGSGNVHASEEHLYAILQFCKKYEIQRVFLHLFTDGRDSPIDQGKELVQKLQDYLNTSKVGQIATICGRYYGMDRDRRWDRTRMAYDAIVSGKGHTASSAVEAVTSSYARKLTDEFIEPTVIVNPSSNMPIATVDDNDGVIFFNYRIDRPRQMTMALTMPGFEKLKDFQFGFEPDQGKALKMKASGPTFKREKVARNLFFVTMTNYQEGLPVNAIVYGKPVVSDSLTEVISSKQLKQMHMSESEKERFVTYYFRGMKTGNLAGEETKIVPSPKVATYNKRPEMNVHKLTDEFVRALSSDQYHFFVLNFANPDMVAHTGDLKATIKACEEVDKAVGKLVNAVLAVDGCVFITADHGNAEELLKFPTASYFYTTSTGSIDTDHSNNPVPYIIICNSFKGKSKELKGGGLHDVAPTVLSLMGIQKPTSMTGINLLE